MSNDRVFDGDYVSSVYILNLEYEIYQSRSRAATFLRERVQTKPVVFPKVRPHAPNTVQTPASSELTLWGRFKQWIWRVGGILKGRTVKFAFKAGMATALLASPAFFEASRPVFLKFRGEWALISVRPFASKIEFAYSSDSFSISWLYPRRSVL